ncbi:MAG: mechanosensitive ion channel [Thermoplasmata archaeon]|nr:mechanosensitive ion channel [Thermoplasmata archaeon]
MKSRLIAFALIAAMFVALFSPMMLDDSDALENTDYKIDVRTSGQPASEYEATIANGHSKSWVVSVMNNSDKELEVTYTLAPYNSNLDVKMDGDWELGHHLYPYGSSKQYLVEDKITISADSLSESYDGLKVVLTLTIWESGDIASAVSQDITITINIASIYDAAGEYNKFLGIFVNDLPEPFNDSVVPAILTVLFWMVISQILCRLIAPRLAKILDSHTTDDDAEKFKKAITWLITVLVLMVSFIQGLDIYGASAEIKASVISFTSIITIAITLVIAWKVYLLIVEGILARLEDNEDSPFDLTLMPLMNMIGKIIFWVVGLATILGALGVDLGGILISAGVVSLGITMGAQNVLSQFFSGIVILTTRPFKKGDFLKINDKIYIVKKVKIMFTEFLGWDRDMVITMPNNAVTSATIINLTKDDEAYRLYIYFTVAYKSDLKKVEEIMLNVANSSPVVLHDYHAKPNVRLTNFLGSGLELRLGVTVKDFDGNITAASSLRMAVYQSFLENGIEVPYNRVEVDMLQDIFKGARRPGDTVED